MTVQKSRLGRLLKISGFTAAGAYGLLCLFGCSVADSMIFPAPRPSYDASFPGLVRIPSASKDSPDVTGLWIPRAGAKTAILYLHGNGEDLGHVAGTLGRIGELTDCSVLGIDYPGYGLTGGEASEDGCYAATEGAFARLQTEFGYKPEAVVVLGRSLGTGPAVDLATKHTPKGLILIAPYTSTFRVVTKVRLLPVDRFNNIGKIDAVRCPLLIIHGDRDEVIPFSHGEALFEAAENASPKRFLRIPGGYHNRDMPGEAHAREFVDAIREITGR